MTIEYGITYHKNLKEKYPELREELKNKKGIKLLQLWL